MNRSIQWAASHNTVVQKILRRARHGEQVVFIPGNHDEALREYAGVSFGDIRIEREWIHESADGRRYGLVRINLILSRIRRILRMPGYWSLAGYAKQKVKKAASFIFDFEDAIVHAARQRGVDGVICGHIHWPSDRMVDGVRYLNCGDWVDTCSGIIEHPDGRIEIIRWSDKDAPHVLPGESLGVVDDTSVVPIAVARSVDCEDREDARRA